MSTSRLGRLGVTLSLGLAGALVNLWPVSLFSGVDVLFGGILALAPVILYGPVLGALSVVISLLPTLALWGHPFALILSALEALILGWLLRRNRAAVVESSLLYWLFVGAPLVLLFYVLVGQQPVATAVTVLGKQALNSIASSVACSLWLHLTGLEARLIAGRSRAWPLKSYLLQAVAVVVLVPTLGGTVAFGRWYLNASTTHAAEDTVAFGRVTTEQVQMLTDRYLEEVSTLAAAATPLMGDARGLSHLIGVLQRTNSDYLSIEVTAGPDRVSSGLACGSPDSMVLPRSATEAYLTPLHLCSSTGEMTSLVVAPIIDSSGQYAGYVQAALSLDRLARHFHGHASAHEQTFVVVDDAERVILSTAPDWRPAQHFRPEAMGLVEPGIGGTTLVTGTTGTAMLRWHSSQAMWRHDDPRTGWGTVVFTPLAATVNSLQMAYAMLMSGSLLLLCGTVLLNRHWSARVAAPLEGLATQVEVNSDAVGGAAWRFESPVMEVNTLAGALTRDVRRRRETEASLAAHNEILQLVALGKPLHSVLQAVADQVEREAAGSHCTIFLVGEATQILLPVTSSRMPEERSGGEPRCEIPLTATDGTAVGLLRLHLSAGGLTEQQKRSVQGLAQLASLALERTRAAERLEMHAYHDPVTGLLNRTAFATCMEDQQERRALFLIDLDNFKMVNDSLGHDLGDQLLALIAGRLQTCLGPGDLLARHGGDEFTLMQRQDGSVPAALAMAEDLIRTMAEPFHLGERDFVVTCSMGVVVEEGEPETTRELLRKADMAMYQVKRNGKSGFALFDRKMSDTAEEQLQLAAELRLALERHELRLYYQPLVSLRARSAIGFEALVRWEHPTRGLVSPAQFIPLAEETGLILQVGHWVLQEACRQASVWEERFPNRPPRVNVNLSVRQFTRHDVVAEVAQVLAETGLTPTRLRLEITESIMLDDAEATIVTLERLKALGVTLAIDDFGSGYSSLNYLRHFPFDDLKINRSFVEELGVDPRTTALVSTMMRLAQALNLSVTAEGIETREQAELLEEMGCQVGQGYYYARPQPPEQAERWLVK